MNNSFFNTNLHSKIDALCLAPLAWPVFATFLYLFYFAISSFYPLSVKSGFSMAIFYMLIMTIAIFITFTIISYAFSFIVGVFSFIFFRAEKKIRLRYLWVIFMLSMSLLISNAGPSAFGEFGELKLVLINLNFVFGVSLNMYYFFLLASRPSTLNKLTQKDLDFINTQKIFVLQEKIRKLL